MADVTLDLMEYTSDANAQAAYVTNDTFDSYTKVCGHFDGADGATAYTDPIAGAYTFAGTAQLDTAQKVFGSASLLLDGNSDYVTLPSSTNYDFGTGDFTLEIRVRFNSLPTSGDNMQFMSRYAGASAVGEWIWQVHNISGTYKFRFITYTTSYQVYSVDFVTITTGVWYTLAVSRTSGTLKFFQDGAQVGVDKTVSETLTGTSYTLAIGVQGSGVLAGFLDGWIDEVRVSKGIGRYTGNYTPATTAFPNDLQSYSESTIKTQGSYSLKGIASTGALNKTLTRTIGSPIDLTGKDTIKFSIYSSRTGNNIKIGIHDSGGTTTEKTYTVLSANTWETVIWDISAVSTANKDAIDSIIVTVSNADSTNTFYLDNMYGTVSLGGGLFFGINF